MNLLKFGWVKFDLVAPKENITSVRNALCTHERWYYVLFFVHTGVVGDWKNNFTAEQSKEMDETFKARLAGTRLGALLKYEQHCQYEARK